MYCLSSYPVSTFFHSPWPSGPSEAPSSCVILRCSCPPVIWHSVSVIEGPRIPSWKWKSSLLSRQCSLVEHRSALNKPKLECKQPSNRKIELVATKFICSYDSHSFLLSASKPQACRPYGFLVGFCGSLLVSRKIFMEDHMRRFICLPPQHQVDFGTHPTSRSEYRRLFFKVKATRA